MAPKKKTDSQNKNKYATSEECLNCKDQCSNGRKFIVELNNKKVCNCPVCVRK